MQPQRPIPVVNGMKVFNPREGNEDFFWYAARVTGLNTVTPNGTSIINIDADSDFLCVAFSYQADIAGALVTDSTNVIPLVNVQINDTGSGKSLSNIPVPLPSIAGSGQLPYRFNRPRVFQSNATVQLNWQAYQVAGTTYSITFVMHGIKVYK
jgi:hypothetical protein